MTYNSILDSEDYTYEYFLQDDVCRLCWNRNAFLEIITQTGNSQTIKNEFSEKIKGCLNIDLSLRNYPNKACEDCCSHINKFYDFKTLCLEKEKKLNAILNLNYQTVHVKEPHDINEYKTVQIEEPTEFTEKESDVKIETDPDLDSFDSFFDCFQQSKTNCELAVKKLKTLKYKHKRSPTYCNICRTDYENEENYTQHNSEYHGIELDGVYKCFGCVKRFKNRKTRLGHEIHFCKELKNGYKCQMCERYLPKRRMYESHMRDHRENTVVDLPEDIFKCKKCFSLFKDRDSLKEHMVVHETEKKNFVCESCGRVFTRQDYLHKHKLTHTGVKQHVCPHCGFRTTQRSSLTVHIRKHTGERPYRCELCPQRCVSSSNLRAHARKHLGLKQHECTICGKKFGYKVSLEEHITSKHAPAQSHTCEHCGATYTRVRGLRRHLLAKHTNKDKEDLKENVDTGTPGRQT